ncbi:MAG: ribonuclease Z [Deltaproteobacteria bacterium]|nr:ribonuclease Z [Candidatus Anaeroferrophillacea bacterium]
MKNEPLITLPPAAGRAMTVSFLPRLVNDPGGDPGTYVRIRHERHAALFDLGAIGALTPRELLKLSHIFVSHCHIDHFIGFDHLLRTILGRPLQQHLYGPPGFIDHVGGRLRGYTWNLVTDYELVLHVTEFDAAGRLTTVPFVCADGFAPGAAVTTAAPDLIIAATPRFRVRTALFDHAGLPVAGYRLEEPMQVNFRRERLHAENWPPGPWLTTLRRAIRDGVADDFPLTVAGDRHTVGELREKLAIIAPGQVFGYLTDLAATPTNLAQVHRLLTGCDVLFCEAAFLDDDRQRARQTGHLTAREAGVIAADIGARKLVLFHFSPKNHHRRELYYRQAGAAFHGELD